MTKEDIKNIDEANKWCERFGLHPITFVELKRREQIMNSAWCRVYTSIGVKYFT